MPTHATSGVYLIQYLFLWSIHSTVKNFGSACAIFFSFNFIAIQGRSNTHFTVPVRNYFTFLCLCLVCAGKDKTGNQWLWSHGPFAPLILRDDVWNEIIICSQMGHCKVDIHSCNIYIFCWPVFYFIATLHLSVI